MSQSGGLLSSIKALLATLLAMAQTRLELVANEMEENRLRIIRLMFYSLFMMFFFSLGVILLTLLVIAIFWDSHRILVIGLLALSYLSIAAWLATYVVCQRKAGRGVFTATLAELAKDRAAIEAKL